MLPLSLSAQAGDQTASTEDVQAGTAIPHIANLLRTGEVEVVAQGVEERASRLQNELVFTGIDIQAKGSVRWLHWLYPSCR